jgi:membrane-bound lytic murein transglycosylase B
MSSLRRVPRALFAAVLAVAVFSPALGATPAWAAEGDELIGYSPDAEPFPEDVEWVDPVELFDLDPDSLLPAPDFDPDTLHNSTVFASGIDEITVEGQDLQPFVDRHVRVLQAIETLARDIDIAAFSINIRRPSVGQLNNAISHEHREEERLTEEIRILKAAIAEFAVRAFISEDEIDTALSVPDSGLSEKRVVTDVIRADQVIQIANREAELAERRVRRANLEEDRRVVRSELRVLRRERDQLFAHHREARALLDQTAASYQVAMHDRLPDFIEGTDIPLVALNAYVIAARAQVKENPSCSIEWWMLAGIGKIESLHGHFGRSTLDWNGNTTDDIRGPALDGRILSGAEFLVDGVVLPEPSDRTEAIEIPVVSAETNTGPGGAPDGPPVALANAEAAPVSIVKRLALIKDSDDGRLDGDNIYDRAVGPMQFIPQTWRRFEADGNLDDDTDPQNVYDATLASARYLCKSTNTMATPKGREQAYFAYNHDIEYSESVAAAADFYSRAIDFPDESIDGFDFGIADPSRQTPSGRASELLKSLDGSTLLDW